MKHLIITAALASTLCSCGIYKTYEPITTVPDSLYGETKGDTAVTVQETDTANIALTHWRDFFTDARLQELISRALSQNTDLLSAKLRVDEAAATLKAAKLAFLPSFAIAPQAGVSSFNNAKATQTYSVPLTMSWEIDVFGRMRNAKKQSEALYAKSQDYQQAVQTQVVAYVASTYYSLSTLREQLAISQETEQAWDETLKTARALMNVGRFDESSVNQMEASLHQVHTSVLTLQQQITETENAMAILLGETPRHYETGSVADFSLPEVLSVGVPLQLLSMRPDVRVAQRSVESAFYGVNQAKSAFYPSLVLSGSVGWTNNAGALIVNPGRLLASALASLTAPVFNRGQNMAQLKIAQAQQEEAKLSFTQTLLNAGKEVNDALSGYQTANEKKTSLAAEVEALQKALRHTTLLMEHGNNTYLEILTARQSLLSAQLSESANNLALVQQSINLYQALGGGTE